MNTIIEQVFLRNIISFIIITSMIIGLLIFIRWSLKEDVRFKRIFATSVAISILVITIMVHNLSQTFFDIKNEDYITYYGEYIERGYSNTLKTVVVYDNQGKEIKLLRSGPSENGTYYGTVIYGKRSEIVVEYKGYKISD